MNNPAMSGEIICNNMRKKPSLRRFIEQKLNQFVRGHLLDPSGRSYYYLVYFDTKADPGTGRETVTCELDLIGSKRLWFSHEVGRKPKEAFFKALQDLEPITQPAA